MPVPDYEPIRICLHVMAVHDHRGINVAELERRVTDDVTDPGRYISTMVKHRLVRATRTDGIIRSLSITHRGLRLLTALEHPVHAARIRRLPLSVGIGVGVSLGIDIDPQYMAHTRRRDKI